MIWRNKCLYWNSKQREKEKEKEEGRHWGEGISNQFGHGEGGFDMPSLDKLLIILILELNLGGF